MSNSISLSPDEKLVIIPDVHNKCLAAEKIILRENPGKVLFLGDYFDGFYDTVKDADNTSKWLARSLQQKDRVHLIGNHDLSYMTDNPKLKCTGYELSKHRTIKNNDIPWSRMMLFCWVDDWLCTHAGLSNEFYIQQKTKESDSVQKVLEMSRHDFENIDDDDYSHVFFQAGLLRGGPSPVGGILWCHYGEFVDIPGVKQIFGHTRSEAIRHRQTRDSEHYCIDTQLNHYAVYQDRTMKIKPAGHI